MNSALKCTLTLAAGVLALRAPRHGWREHSPCNACPEPGTLMLLAGGLATVIGARKFRKG